MLQITTNFFNLTLFLICRYCLFLTNIYFTEYKHDSMSIITKITHILTIFCINQTFKKFKKKILFKNMRKSVCIINEGNYTSSIQIKMNIMLKTQSMWDLSGKFQNFVNNKFSAYLGKLFSLLTFNFVPRAFLKSLLLENLTFFL